MPIPAYFWQAVGTAMPILPGNMSRDSTLTVCSRAALDILPDSRPCRSQLAPEKRGAGDFPRPNPLMALPLVVLGYYF